MTWTVDLQTRAGGAIAGAADLPVAALRAVWSLDGPGSVEVDLKEEDAAHWLAGQRRVIVRRDGTAEWAGWLLDLGEDTKRLEDTLVASLRASGLGLASVLGERVVHGDFSRQVVVATTIAWDLINHAQGQTDGAYGFTLGTVTGTAPARTRHYCDGEVIADRINELAAKDPGGFDWEIDPAGAFNAWVGGRGVVSGRTLGRDDAREWHVEAGGSDLITYCTALGDSDEPCGAPLVIRSSTLATTHGRREAVVDLDTTDAGELTEAADEELRSRGASRLRVHALFDEAKLPWAWGDLWVGDHLTVELPAHFGGNQTLRVIEVGISVEPPDFGFVDYEFEAV
jgi:hypothetical protein